MSILDAVRPSCRLVAERARHVRITTEEIVPDRYPKTLPLGESGRPQFDAAHHFRGGIDETVGYVLCLDSINFGSGWFPAMTKRPGLSGYFTVSTSLKERFERDGGWSAHQLAALTAGEIAEVLGQTGNPAVGALMTLFATSLNDLGRWVIDRFAGHYPAVPEEAGGSAVALVDLLTEMPMFRDTASYRGLDVWFLKRAQLTAVDLSLAFDGGPPARFGDLDRLTIFADNLVPHVLRTDGLLTYSTELAEAVAAGRLLPAGSEQEVEIRACAVHAVELLVPQLAGRASAADLDFLLWNKGQHPAYRNLPRHRTRTTNY